jgi:release factor glutamine methyltransferase
LRTEDFISEFLAAQEGGSTAYEPREDTFLVLEALGELSVEGLRVLDMGTGSGILATYCARRGADVTASDIDTNAIRALGRVSVHLNVNLKLIVSDLFSRIDGRFDLIFFNPPYLPSHGVDDQTVDGGENGARVINGFLNQVSQHLTEDGFAMLLVSSLNKPERLGSQFPNLRFETLRDRSLFFERLYVLRVSRQRNASSPV